MNGGVIIPDKETAKALNDLARHKCNKKGGKHYLVYKEGYGWACPECGYIKRYKEWEGAKV